MTEKPMLGARLGPDHLVAQAERQLAAIGEQLDILIETLSQGQTDAARDVAPAVASLRKALEAIFHERARLEKIERSDGQSAALDLDAARAEIDRRMDRLVASLDTGGVSDSAR